LLVPCSTWAFCLFECELNWTWTRSHRKIRNSAVVTDLPGRRTMSASFTCPHCGLVSEIDPAHVGKTGPCRGCGKDVTVPFPREANLPPTAGPKSSATPWIVGCGIAAAVLVIGGLVVCGGLAFVGYRATEQMKDELIRIEAEVKREQEEAMKAQEEAAEAMEDAPPEEGEAASEPPIPPAAPNSPESAENP
jgi:hypothetical protein